MKIRCRLRRDGKIVGYEKHENGRIFHSENGVDNCLLYAMEKESVNWYDILRTSKKYGRKGWMHVTITHPFYIPHDTADMYTGIDIDGVKVFELSKVSWAEYGKTWEGVVRYEHGRFVICEYSDSGDKFALYDFNLSAISQKVTGISNVKENGND